MGSYFGGVLNSSTIDGVETKGGWASAWVKASPQVKLSAGFGMDDPTDDDIGNSRSKNTAYFGNIQYSLVSNLVIGFEVSQWQTEYYDGVSEHTTYDNLRAQTSFIMNF
jgi:hypothetical protein